MSSLKGALWIEGQSPASTQLAQKVQSFCTPEMLVQVESSGVWVISDGLTVLLETAISILLEFGEDCKLFVTMGDLSLTAGRWSGWAMTQAESLKSTVDFGQIWFTEGVACAVDLDQHRWDDLGLISVDDRSAHCFRLLTNSQCFIPSALRRAIQANKCVMAYPGDPNPAVRKGQHMIFIGFDMDDGLMLRAEKALQQIANERIWLVSPNVSREDRRVWSDLGRQLIVGTPERFQAKLLAVGGTVVESNATLFLDPVGNTAGELALVGVAIPRVPMAKIIDGYSIDLLETGEWGFDEDRRVALVSMSMSGLFITVYQEGCRLNSRAMTVGQPYSLGTAARLTIGHKTIRYIGGVGKPYEGIFIGEATQRMALNVGTRTEVGRQPVGFGMVMQERGGLERLVWSSNPQAERAKAQSLTLDRALTGRQHTAILALDKQVYTVQSLHDKLPTFAFSHSANRLHRIVGEETVRGESLLVVGTNLLQIG